MMRLPDIGVPVLAVLGTEPDPMGWGTLPEDVLSHLPPGGRLAIVEGAGHFVHIEQPHEVAALVLEHLLVSAARHDPPAAQQDRPRPPRAAGRRGPSAAAPARARASGRPSAVPDHLAAWPGPVWALDLTGHGASTSPSAAATSARC